MKKGLTFVPTHVIIITVKGISQYGESQKGQEMEKMTDYQFKKIIQMVLSILKKCSSLDEAIKEIEALLEK